MKFNQFILAFCCLTMCACASIHSKNAAKKISGDQLEGLIISAAEVSDPNKEAFSLVTFNLENKSSEWIRIEKAEILIGDDIADKVSVVTGRDLVDWSHAMAQRVKLERHNRGMKQVALIGAASALLVGSASDLDEGGIYAGSALLAGVESWILFDAIAYGRAAAQNPETLPEHHLYQSFSVPGRMFMKRWVLFNKPPGIKIKDLPVKFTFVDGRESTYLITLKEAA